MCLLRRPGWRLRAWFGGGARAGCARRRGDGYVPHELGLSHDQRHGQTNQNSCKSTYQKSVSIKWCRCFNLLITISFPEAINFEEAKKTRLLANYLPTNEQVEYNWS